MTTLLCCSIGLIVLGIAILVYAALKMASIMNARDELHELLEEAVFSDRKDNKPKYTMKICYEHSDEIVHEGLVCPACEEISELDEKIEDLESKIDGLNSEIKELRSASN